MIAETDVPRASPLREVVGTVLRAPFAARTWLATTHMAVGALLGLLTLTVFVVLGVLTIGLGVTVVLGAICLAVLFRCADGLSAWQRARFAVLLGVDLAAAPRQPVQDGWLARLAARCRDRATWRQLVYHSAAALLGTIGFAVVAVTWAAGLIITGRSVYQWFFGAHAQGPVALGALTLLGPALLLLAPWIARAVAAADVGLARTLLGSRERDVLIEQVESLVETRAGVIDAADAERRRIERDLHDGTQQRLTSLAMRLGIARETLLDLPQPARQAIVSAHDDAKEALSELRAFVRGLHPAVLDDRGLAAALSGITARSPLPVRLDVDVPVRTSPTIEAVAYFVVSESLTNIAKHAQATEVEVTVRRVADRLRVRIADDGRGGASEHGGSGLRGLRQRVAAVDGSIRIDSPVKVGTVITVELPCGS